MNFDFTYTMEAIEKYKDDDSVNINSVLQHDNALSFAKWKDITNDVEQYIYVYEKDEIVTIYNADKDLNNIQQNGTNYSFEYYIKYNVTKVFNYNFLPDDYKCYIDYKDNLIIYTFIYNKENVGTETIQYCFTRLCIFWTKRCPTTFHIKKNGKRFKYRFRNCSLSNR